MRIISILIAKRVIILYLVGVLVWYGIGMAILIRLGAQVSAWVLSILTLGVGLFVYRRRRIINGRVWFTIPEQDVKKTIRYCFRHRIDFELTRRGDDYRMGFIDESDLIQARLGA